MNARYFVYSVGGVQHDEEVTKLDAFGPSRIHHQPVLVLLHYKDGIDVTSLSVLTKSPLSYLLCNRFQDALYCLRMEDRHICCNQLGQLNKHWN